MAIIVQKYGGSSVADITKIGQVAERVAATRASGNQVVVVVSAMGETTDELLALAKQVCPVPSGRELDMLLTAGERISMALLSMALNAKGIPAVSFTGSQSGIITTDDHTNARIVEVRPFRVEEELGKGRVVIVAGYQGVSPAKEVTTLGRGGSDTTAVALAAALGAEACHIYSDVVGVHTADPRVVQNTRRLEEVSYDEMQELAHAGAKVLNAEAVEFAKGRGIVIHSRHAFRQEGETKIHGEPMKRKERVAGVASKGGLALLRWEGGWASPQWDAIEGRTATPKEFFVDGEGAVSLVLSSSSVEERLEVQPGVAVEPNLGFVSVVGSGLSDDLSYVRAFWRALGSVGAAPRLISTSPTRISALVGEDLSDELVRAVHREFFEGG